MSPPRDEHGLRGPRLAQLMCRRVAALSPTRWTACVEEGVMPWSWLAAVLGLVVLTATFASAQEGNKSADLYGAWFTTGSVVSGQRYVGHPENVLPQPTKHFS